MFGKQFTKEEALWLERISANLSKSPKANSRIIDATIKKAEKKAKRGRSRAMKMGREDEATDIKSMMDFRYKFDQPQAKSMPVPQVKSRAPGIVSTPDLEQLKKDYPQLSEQQLLEILSHGR